MDIDITPNINQIQVCNAQVEFEIDKVLLKGFYTIRRDELDKPKLIPSIETSDSEYLHTSQVQVQF